MALVCPSHHRWFVSQNPGAPDDSWIARHWGQWGCNRHAALKRRASRFSRAIRADLVGHNAVGCQRAANRRLVPHHSRGRGFQPHPRPRQGIAPRRNRYPAGQFANAASPRQSLGLTSVLMFSKGEGAYPALLLPGDSQICEATLCVADHFTRWSSGVCMLPAIEIRASRRRWRRYSVMCSPVYPTRGVNLNGAPFGRKRLGQSQNRKYPAGIYRSPVILHSCQDYGSLLGISWPHWWAGEAFLHPILRVSELVVVYSLSVKVVCERPGPPGRVLPMSSFHWIIL